MIKTATGLGEARGDSSYQTLANEVILEDQTVLTPMSVAQMLQKSLPLHSGQTFLDSADYCFHDHSEFKNYSKLTKDSGEAAIQGSQFRQ